MAESSSNLTILLSEAVKKIAQYNWLDAVGLYEKALEVIGEKPERARITSEIGRSYFQSAFQSDSRREFKELMVKAKSAYDSASALYGSDPKSELVRGKSLYTSFWEADDFEERKTLLKKALQVTESAAASLDADEDRAALPRNRRRLACILHLLDSDGLQEAFEPKAREQQRRDRDLVTGRQSLDLITEDVRRQ